MVRGTVRLLASDRGPEKGSLNTRTIPQVLLMTPELGEAGWILEAMTRALVALGSPPRTAVQRNRIDVNTVRNARRTSGVDVRGKPVNADKSLFTLKTSLTKLLHRLVKFITLVVDSDEYR